jgi:hypothetical protein
VSEERRNNRRVAQPLEGSWWGSSGATRCRIGDISESGCFVQSLMNPSPGERTKITVSVGQDSVTLDASVVYAEPGMGFAVRFDNLTPEDRASLSRLVETLGSEGSSTGQ